MPMFSVLGMIKFTSNRSGSRFIVGREGWKGIVVSKLMFGCGALAWFQSECNALDVMQNEMGRWLWQLENVRNELIRGETGWSTFSEREAKAVSDWLLRMIFNRSVISEIGNACLVELGGKSRWWARCRHVCGKFGLDDLVNVTWLGDISVKGLENLGLNLDYKEWRKQMHEKIESSGRDTWRKGFNEESMREREYMEKKSQPRYEKYVREIMGARVRLMLRGGCLQVRGDEKMRWKYECDKCVCGEVESETHVLFNCEQYERERNEWRAKCTGSMGQGNQGSELSDMKGYMKQDGDMEKSTLRYMGAIWSKGLRNERNRVSEDE